MIWKKKITINVFHTTNFITLPNLISIPFPLFALLLPFHPKPHFHLSHIFFHVFLFIPPLSGNRFVLGSFLTFELHNVMSHMYVLFFMFFMVFHAFLSPIIAKCLLMKWKSEQKSSCWNHFFRCLLKFYFYDHAEAKVGKEEGGERRENISNMNERWTFFSEKLQDFLCKFSYVFRRTKKRREKVKKLFFSLNEIVRVP